MLRVPQEDTAKADYLRFDEGRLTELGEAALGEICGQSAQFVHLFEDFLEEQEEHD